MKKRKILSYFIYGVGAVVFFVAIAASTYYFLMPALTRTVPVKATPNLSDTFSKIKENFPRAYIVQSGSMEPTIKTGSIVVSSWKDSYAPGDIVTFILNGNKKNIITHRIEFKQYPEGIDKDPVYITSGDANEDFDNWQIKKKRKKKSDKFTKKG